ncbi:MULTISPECIES: IS630 transposase-related protein [unclassified Acinetobacter]|uniref:IS630 transposase-related protein n=1 Tax=unclassified Acinetobacter TaxID=196816 RepID=UPI00190DADC3|nr:MULTISPECIES: IS630 transposase-related protein [unclassified Acinetobacter]MBK0062487.1 helix-turn-helix domain-containing protein [Acinetobacter sp. S55]MBK0066291.1 helix-turn-helix domain-containing protein [Acinetobacter sp. S54]
MRAYSLDLRKKVMALYYQTGHKSNVCKQFGIARSTLDGWIKLEKETHALEPLPVVKQGRPFSIKNLEDFKQFVETTPFTKIEELLKPFEQKFGYQISYAILWRGLDKIGKTRRNTDKVRN